MSECWFNQCDIYFKVVSIDVITLDRKNGAFDFVKMDPVEKIGTVRFGCSRDKLRKGEGPEVE